jgi:hypothetical protein
MKVMQRKDRYATIDKYKEQTFVYYILGGEKALPQSAIDQLFE